MNLDSSRPVLSCARAEVVFRQNNPGPLWRLRRGWVRLDIEDALGCRLVQLARPGDLLGAEALCDAPYQFSATAWTACELDLVHPQGDGHRHALLQEALQQQQRASAAMSALRTGPVPQRLGQLLDLMGLPWRGTPQGDTLRKSLPTLRDLADVVDAKTETVCRALNQLLPGKAPRLAPAGVALAWPALAA